MLCRSHPIPILSGFKEFVVESDDDFDPRGDDVKMNNSRNIPLSVTPKRNHRSQFIAIMQSHLLLISLPEVFNLKFRVALKDFVVDWKLIIE